MKETPADEEEAGDAKWNPSESVKVPGTAAGNPPVPKADSVEVVKDATETAVGNGVATGDVAAVPNAGITDDEKRDASKLATDGVPVTKEGDAEPVTEVPLDDPNGELDFTVPVANDNVAACGNEAEDAVAELVVDVTGQAPLPPPRQV